MSKDPSDSQALSPNELVQHIQAWIAHQKKLRIAYQKRTSERDQYLDLLFPEGIDIGEEEKVVLIIRQHFPEVSRDEIYSMNPGQIGVYLPFRGFAFHFLRISFATGRAGGLLPIM